MEDIDSLVRVAMTAARTAGDIQRQKYGSDLSVDQWLQYDLKLETDRLCEAAIINTIRSSFPTHAIYAEEGGRLDGSDYVWYVDPLDGTVNFYYGMPHFCTTLACYHLDDGAGDGSDLATLGTPRLGITYAPLLDEMFIAVAGHGAALNNRPLAVREEESLAESYLLAAIGSYPEKADFTRDFTFPLALRVRKMRAMGACAYDLASVAAGRSSGYFEYGVNTWDLAAGRLLVEEAGGCFTGKKLASGKWLFAASGKNIHPDLLGSIGLA
ncbi:MAG: inositol monophosphatase [Planctomycetota bacterium]|jgi:fructose-1,6-bisphosphatase/inositol monophosphatase family enzyme|nr:inositol monophosphatase [Planctomycetota bacterium]